MMDALSNGEVSGASLNDAPKELEDESLVADVVKAFKNNSTTDTIDSVKPAKECSTENEISMKNSSESKPITESNIETPSIVVKLADETAKAKENGISDAEKPLSGREVKTSSSSTEGIDIGDLQQKLEMNSACKSEKVDPVSCQADSSSLNKEPTSEETKNDLETTSPSTSLTTNKENCPDKVNKETYTTIPPSSEAKDTEQCSADQKDTSPDQKDTSPDEKDTSPDEKDTLPDEKDTLPDEKDTSPDRKDTSPDRKDTSPSSITAAVEKDCQMNDQNEIEPTLPPSTIASETEGCSADQKDPENISLSNIKATEKEDSSSTDSVNEGSNIIELNLPLKRAKKLQSKLDGASCAKNHFMAGGSIVSSKDDQCEKQKLNSNHDSKIINADQIMDFSNKILENCNEDSDVDEPMDCDEQPHNFVMEKETGQSLEITVESSPSGSESDKLESALKQLHKNNSNEKKTRRKLKKHLVSDNGNQVNAVSNHTEKNVPSPDITLTPVVEAQPNDSHLTSDKENKCTDSSPLQERLNKESSNSFVFADLSNEETGFPDAFTGLVKIGKYISVKGDFTLRSSEALVESPSLVAPYLLKEPDSFPSKEKDSKSEMKDFFHSAAGEILIGIGLSRVNEWFHKDMVRIKKRQLKRNKKPELEEDLVMHENFYSEAKKANNVYSFDFRVCKTCGFTTESSVVMEGHLLVPHITQRREYQCNFCDIINRDPKEMLEHMQTVHKKIGRIQPPVLFFECIYCTFESNSKVKLNHHLVKCQRVYDQGVNQAPSKDFEYPALTPKPITVAVVKAYEKSLGSMQKGRGRPKKDLSESMQHMNQFSSNAGLSPHTPGHVPPYKGSSNSPLADSLMQNQMMSSVQMPGVLRTGSMGQLRPGLPGMHMPNRFFGVVNQTGQLMPLMGNNHLVNSSSQFPFSQNLDNSGGKKSSSASQYYNKVFDVGQKHQNSSKGMSSVTITPLPKLTGPYPVPIAKPSSASGSNPINSNSLVVCEICDGYIKDLEQLRTHMQLIHKVKIHPKMLVSRPPLNCQKCQWRFFTDQGLERHLLGAHGLVTSNMQEQANKGKDAGCCTICGRVYASKLVSHMNQVHKITLKPAHLSYKCTVCSATFNLYRLFENHVYLVHSGAGKRSADGRSSPSSKKLKSDSPANEEATNHKEKRSDKDVGDENAKKCKCGADVSKDSKSHNDKCEKCLKSDEKVQSTASAKTIKDELKKKDKAIEKAAV